MTDDLHREPGREQGYSEPTQPGPEPDRPVELGTPGREQGYSEPTQPAPVADPGRVPTTPADLPNTSQAEKARAAGYNAEPSEQYDPVAAYIGDGSPEAAPSSAVGNAEEEV